MRFAAVILACFLAVDPTGFDRFGPLRVALISTIGFAVVGTVLVRGTPSVSSPRWVRFAGAAIVAGLALSTALSDDRWHALVGTPDRHFGLITWLLCGGLFLAAHRTAASDATLVPIVLRTLTAATLGVGLYSIAELAELGSLDQDFANDRIGGTFGQPAYLGAAMVLGLPATIVQSARETTMFSRMFALAAAVCGTIALVSSQSRAAWVAATIVAAIVLGLHWRAARDILGPKRSGLASGVVVGVLLMVAVFTPAGERFWSLTESDGVVAGRVDEWQVGVRALADTGTLGVLGHGPETYRTVFGAHVDQGYVMDHGRDTFTDRAHNNLLDTALAGGLVAAAGLAALFAGLCVVAVRTMQRGPIEHRALAAGVLGYTIQGAFLFPLAELDPVFWMLAGILIARPHSSQTPQPDPTAAAGTQPLMAVVAGLSLALAALSLIGGALDVRADHHIKAAASTTEAAAALASADRARSLRPDSIRYHFAAARIASSQPSGLGVAGAIERLEDGLEYSADDPALLHERALILVNEARRTGTPDAIAAALPPLRELDLTDPNHPEGQQRYGIALALDGQTDLAVDQFEHAAYMTPDRPEALINLTVVHLQAGNLGAAENSVRRAAAIAPTNMRVQELLAELGVDLANA